jgi:diadenosine tetraphosphate (Ap4A) HIT family hydrolase
MHNTNCLFCSIAAGTTPCHTIWESETHLAFLSIFPNTEGFTVVIPKKHLSSYAFAQTDTDLSELVVATKQVALLLDGYFDDVARCGMFFEGYGVDHLHSKLFPMHGTAGGSTWEKKESGAVNTYFERYPGYLSSNDSGRADDAALAKLAEKIRTTDHS